MRNITHDTDRWMIISKAGKKTKKWKWEKTRHWPTFLARLMFALFATKNFSILKCPFWAAMNAGEAPSTIWQFTSAPLLRSSCATSRWLHWQATNRGVPPSFGGVVVVERWVCSVMWFPIWVIVWRYVSLNKNKYDTHDYEKLIIFLATLKNRFVLISIFIINWNFESTKYQRSVDFIIHFDNNNLHEKKHSHSWVHQQECHGKLIPWQCPETLPELQRTVHLYQSVWIIWRIR